MVSIDGLCGADVIDVIPSVKTVMRASVKEKLYTFENSAKLFKEAKVSSLFPYPL